MRKLRVRAMPPHGEDTLRPTESEYTTLLSYLERALDAHAASHPDPGRPATFHRLNRIEYQNAVRDLLALEVDASALLPGDNASHGFDNVNVGELSPTLLDQYVAAARKVSRLAVGTPVRVPAAQTVVLPLDLTQNDQVDEALPFGTRGGTTFRHVFPQDGEYQFQIRLTRDRDDRLEGLAEAHQIELTVDGARLQLFELPALTAAQTQSAAYADKEGDADARLRGRFPVSAGPHTVGVAFLKKSVRLERGGAATVLRRLQRAQHGGGLLGLGRRPVHRARGPGETPSRRRIFSLYAGDRRKTRRHVRAASSPRWRGGPTAVPSTPAESTISLAFYNDGRAGGGSFDHGIEMALRALLVSPQFLFRIERDPSRHSAAHPLPA